MNNNNQHPTKQKAVFLDRDGVINRLELGLYTTSWEKFEFLEGAAESIAPLNEAGYLIIVITNQSAINRGMMTQDDLEVIHGNMVAEIEKAGGRVDGIYFCPHRPDEDCGCRKPKPGMFDQINEDFDIDYSKSWFVGDFESDRQVAEAVGLNFIMVKGDNGLRNALSIILK